MRILHLDCGREMRGGQWQVLWLVEGLAAGGHQSTLLAPAGSPLFREASGRGLDVRPLRLQHVRALARRCDIVHAHDARSHTIAAVLARCPLVVARRVAFPPRTGLLSRWKYSRAAHYIAVSKHVSAGLAAAGVAEEKITVVYDGVPTPQATAAGPLIVAPRTEDPAKGTALAREAASLAGVEIHFSSRMEADLPRARLLVYLTHQEGLGSAALLAMAHGVPVVASRVGGLVEIIDHGGTGLLVDNEPAAIAAAIRRLLDDEEVRRAMAAIGRRAVLENFTVDHMIRATLSVYQRVFQCSKPS
jgi:hypothetical protein